MLQNYKTKRRKFLLKCYYFLVNALMKIAKKYSFNVCNTHLSCSVLFLLYHIIMLFSLKGNEGLIPRICEVSDKLNVFCLL